MFNVWKKLKLDGPAVPSYSWLDNHKEGVNKWSIVESTLTLIFLMSVNLLFSQASLNRFLLRIPFLAHVFTAHSVNESHVICCFVIVQLNSSWRQHTPVFSSPLRGTGHDPSHIVPLFLQCCPPLAAFLCQNTSLAINRSHMTPTAEITLM